MLEQATKADVAARRKRLRNPRNAVPDAGIDLRRGRSRGWRPALGPRPDADETIPVNGGAKTPCEQSVLRIGCPCHPSLNDPCDSWHCLLDREWSVRTSESTVALRHILIVVAARYELQFRALLSHRRTARLARPRMIAVYLAVELTQLSTPQIGRGLGGRDHSSILYSHRKIARQRAMDAQLDREITELIDQLRQEA